MSLHYEYFVVKCHSYVRWGTSLACQILQMWYELQTMNKRLIESGAFHVASCFWRAVMLLFIELELWVWPDHRIFTSAKPVI